MEKNKKKKEKMTTTKKLLWIDEIMFYLIIGLSFWFAWYLEKYYIVTGIIVVIGAKNTVLTKGYLSKSGNENVAKINNSKKEEKENEKN